MRVSQKRLCHRNDGVTEIPFLIQVFNHTNKFVNATNSPCTSHTQMQIHMLTTDTTAWLKHRRLAGCATLTEQNVPVTHNNSTDMCVYIALSSLILYTAITIPCCWSCANKSKQWFYTAPTLESANTLTQLYTMQTGSNADMSQISCDNLLPSLTTE